MRPFANCRLRGCRRPAQSSRKNSTLCNKMTVLGKRPDRIAGLRNKKRSGSEGSRGPVCRGQNVPDRIHWRLSTRRAHGTCVQDGWSPSLYLHLQSGGRTLPDEIVHFTASLTVFLDESAPGHESPAAVSLFPEQAHTSVPVVFMPVNNLQSGDCHPPGGRT
jgi:hypothetical protein